MIVLLPCCVRVRIIVKDKGYPPIHEHTIMYEVPTFFHFHYHLIQLWLYFPSYHIISHIICRNIYHIFHAYVGVVFYASSSFCMLITSNQSYYRHLLYHNLSIFSSIAIRIVYISYHKISYHNISYHRPINLSHMSYHFLIISHIQIFMHLIVVLFHENTLVISFPECILTLSFYQSIIVISFSIPNLNISFCQSIIIISGVWFVMRVKSECPTSPAF